MDHTVTYLPKARKTILYKQTSLNEPKQKDTDVNQMATTVYLVILFC